MKKIVLLVLLVFCMGGLTAAWANPPAHAGAHGAEKKQNTAPKHNKENKGNKDKKDKKGNKQGPAAKGESYSDNLISATITALVAREFAVQGGWTSYKPLPPGIAKNLSRGKPLPPGIAKKTVPAAMLQRLPAYPGYNWCAVGTDLVLLNVAGNVIADVLHNVFD